MLSKNLILALLAAWLLGSVLWQYFIIMKCKTGTVQTETSVVNSDSLALSDSLSNLQMLASDSINAAVAASDTAKLSTPAVGTTEEDLAKNEKYSSVFKPLNLYFRTNEANYIKTDENQKFLNDAKAYLSEHKDKSLSLTGHTDSDGPEAANQTLSERRASDVKKQLAAKGFSVDQLNTDAKGETQPTASNDTPEGKKANRRVTIVVNQ